MYAWVNLCYRVRYVRIHTIQKSLNEFKLHIIFIKYTFILNEKKKKKPNYSFILSS